MYPPNITFPLFPTAFYNFNLYPRRKRTILVFKGLITFWFSWFTQKFHFIPVTLIFRLAFCSNENCPWPTQTKSSSPISAAMLPNFSKDQTMRTKFWAICPPPFFILFAVHVMRSFMHNNTILCVVFFLCSCSAEMCAGRENLCVVLPWYRLTGLEDKKFKNETD